MLKNYFPARHFVKIAWRNLGKSKIHSFINIGGLAAGMTVAMLIGLWIYDEVSFNKYYHNYERVGKVMGHHAWEGRMVTNDTYPVPLGTVLRSFYGSDFKYVVTAREIEEHIISSDDKKFTQSGSYMQPDGPEMLTLEMVHGSRNGLKELNSILLSQSLAEKLFGKINPVEKIVKIDNKTTAKVTGVYKDMPDNTEFKEAKFIAPFDLYFASNDWANKNDWKNFNMQVYVQLNPHADFGKASAKIKDVLVKYGDKEAGKPVMFLQPMRKWHLHSSFENHVEVTSKQMQFVWFYGIIGVFVLLLACINFMNLSTARSEKRAKEVGIRKTIGSVRRQLIYQFFIESLLVAVLAFILSLFLVQLILPWFNDIAAKKISVPWANPLFWLTGIGFTIFTGLLAGSYPALYLSSFNPVKVLKGTFRAGRFAFIPRKVLVVVQFTVSVALIIGTMIVYRQIQFTKDRPVGYTRDGLITMGITSPDYNGKYEILRTELKNTGVVSEMAESARSITNTLGWNGGFQWRGQKPSFNPSFNTIWVSPEYGKTVGWQFVQGRDFSREFGGDSSGIVINETAKNLMGLQNPVGEYVNWKTEWNPGGTYKILGVIKDVLNGSPFEPAFPAIFFMGGGNWIFIRVNPAVSTGVALPKIEAAFKKILPSVPFDYKFADEEYGKKFAAEERIGTLAFFFAVLAILISCLGLFGLASFTAEQRVKEIGVRKVLGASVFNLWRLLSKEFLILVGVSLFIGIPVAYYIMHNWLQDYQYRTELSWWIFGAAAVIALLITILTVSFHAIKAAVANPAKSLRTE